MGTKKRGRRCRRPRFIQFVCVSLNSCNVVRAGAFLTLSYFEFYDLSVVEAFVAAAVLDFGMMYKEIFSAIIWRDETETLVCIEPLNCTFTHVLLFVLCIDRSVLHLHNNFNELLGTKLHSYGGFTRFFYTASHRAVFCCYPGLLNFSKLFQPL
ncbi:MAG: hypothetical protein ACI9TH_002228 [Kiritimatiellia bacterium]|jgi:hypothetical protein